MEDQLKDQRRYETAQRIYDTMLMDINLKDNQGNVDYDKVADAAVRAADAFINRLYLHHESEGRNRGSSKGS